MKIMKRCFFAVALEPASEQKEVVLFVQREESLLKKANADAAQLIRIGYNVWVYSNADTTMVSKQMLAMRAKNEAQCILYTPTAIGMIFANLSVSYGSLISKSHFIGQGRKPAGSI